MLAFQTKYVNELPLALPSEGHVKRCCFFGQRFRRTYLRTQFPISSGWLTCWKFTNCAAITKVHQRFKFHAFNCTFYRGAWAHLLLHQRNDDGLWMRSRPHFNETASSWTSERLAVGLRSQTTVPAQWKALWSVLICCFLLCNEMQLIIKKKGSNILIEWHRTCDSINRFAFANFHTVGC